MQDYYPAIVKHVLEKNWNVSYYSRLLLSIQLLTLAISTIFPSFALLTKIRRFHRTLLINKHGILCAILTPMPIVILTSSNILNHSYHLFQRLAWQLA